MFISAAKQCLDTMEKGSRLLKVRGKNSKYRRMYKIDSDHIALQYHSTKMCSGGNNKGRV